MKNYRNYAKFVLCCILADFCYTYIGRKFYIEFMIIIRQEIVMYKQGKKIVILGAGNVGATIAYTLTLDGIASEIVLVDINMDKAKGEAMDIIQGTAFCPPVNIYSGDYDSAKDADIVIVTVGMGRKPGQSRLDLAQNNVNIVKNIMPQVKKHAPDAVYVVVSNPVDILTYSLIKTVGLDPQQVLGSGTLLDTARLRERLAEHVNLSPQNVHAYVLGEHGDTSVIPWSLATIGGLTMQEYCTHVCSRHNQCGKAELRDIEDDVRTSGAKVIGYKGATYYAIALTVRRICECLMRRSNSILTVSGMLNDYMGIDDVCLSVPFIISSQGIQNPIQLPLTEQEHAELLHSAKTLRGTLSELDI